MILGIGTDIVAIPNFREQLADPASRFAEGTFTPNERQLCASRPSRDPAQHLAGRFAAKEAFIKAWSSTFWGQPFLLSPASVDLREAEVIADAYGRPKLRLTGQLAEIVQRSLGAVRIHLSISHDGDFAQAYVIIEQ